MNAKGYSLCRKSRKTTLCARKKGRADGHPLCYSKRRKKDARSADEKKLDQRTLSFTYHLRVLPILVSLRV